MSAPGFPPSCTARLGWGLPGSAIIVDCDQPAGHRAEHSGDWHHHLHPTNTTRITWQDEDRRTFHGGFQPCPITGCVLPGGHRGDHAR